MSSDPSVSAKQRRADRRTEQRRAVQQERAQLQERVWQLEETLKQIASASAPEYMRGLALEALADTKAAA